MHKHWFHIPLLPALLLSVSLASTIPMSHAAGEWRSGVPRTAYATLFEWSWDAVARECTNVLGPKGYAAVQVSPPMEHIGGGAWWTRYQPLSYRIQSRSGNRDQFRAMVDTCRTAGVDVYVDTVINHMAAVGHSFPSVPYGSSDFHHGCTIQQSDYGDPGNRTSVTQCSLVGLPDLDTGSGSVQEKIAAYMNDLLSLGVAGFRIDAAKHIRPAELSAIKARVPGSYFFTQEVIRDGNVGPELPAYAAMGSVNEFSYIHTIRNAFLNRGSSLSALNTQIGGSNFLPSHQATVFVHNHDTERKECNGYSTGSVCDSLNTFNGDKLYLADIFMLAHNYGYPSVASGYYFDNHDMGPPQAQPYNGSESTPSNCSSTVQMGKWDCLHRDHRIANMVGFRNYTNGTDVNGWVAGDNSQIAFNRGNKGFVAINNSGNTWQRTFSTGLPNGSYCNVLASANPEHGSCPGTAVSVNGGQVTLSIAPGTAVALHVGARDFIEPPPPRSVDPIIGPITEDSVTISWLPSTDPNVAAYRIYLNGILRTTVTTGDRTVITGLNPDTSYTVTIRTVDNAGNVSAAGTGRSFRTPPASNTAIVYYQTTWTKAYGFHSRYAPMPGLQLSNACTNYKTRSVDLGSLSSVMVQFHNGAGQTDPASYTVRKGVNILRNGSSTLGSDPCDLTPPTMPGPIDIIVLPSGSVSLSWAPSTDNVGVVGYHIYRDAVRIGTTTTPGYQDTLVPQPGRGYVYGVAAYDAAGNVSERRTLPWTAPPQALTVTFKVTASTASGESVYITGNRSELGNWSTSADAGRRCLAGAASVWTCSITFPTGTQATIEYKYQKIGAGVTWETGSNRSYTISGNPAIREDGSFRQ